MDRPLAFALAHAATRIGRHAASGSERAFLPVLTHLVVDSS